MYSSTVTARAIEKANEALATQARERGTDAWELRYHSPQQIRWATDHLNGLWDADQGILKRDLNPDEQRFIVNERRLCMLDFRYWISNYAWIINWARQPQPFMPNIAQSIILDIWAEREEAGLAIWLQNLKARRLGVSTLTELAVQHRFQFHPYTNAVIASADPKKTVQMGGIIGFCLERQPWWLHPETTKVAKGIPAEFGKQHCSLTIEAGNQFTGVARGSTPNVVHLSELCEWDNARELVDAALMRAIIDTPDTFGVLESTGGGTGDWWHDTWKQNTRDAERGRARVIPLFLPWFVGTDLYPSDADLRARPIPRDWQPSERTQQHADRAQEYVLSDPLLFKHLAKGDRSWSLTRAQMWWHEMEYETHAEKKELNVFYKELCANPFEAFQSSNVPVIDIEVLMSYQDRVRPPVGVYTILGPDIPQHCIVPRRYWDESMPILNVNTRDILSRFNLQYQFVPLKFEGYARFEPGMKLLVWEFPEDGETYGIGVDTSEGVGQDNAVIQVLREGSRERPPAQVAEFAYDFIKALQLWPLVTAIATFYSTYSAAHGRIAQARLAIECRANGEACQYEIQKRGWTNFHRWRSYATSYVPPADQVQRIGIYTDEPFRKKMFDMLLGTIDEEAIDLPSPYLIDELRTLERDATAQKSKAAFGAHDDRVLALGFILFSLHINKPPSRQFRRQRVQYVEGALPASQINHPVWSPGDQASSTAFVRPPHQRIYRKRDRGPLAPYVNPDLPITSR